MILDMTLQTFTLFHVLISLIGIGSGFVVVYGFFTSKRLNRWTAVFLVTTALTSLTGFLFPFNGITPGFKIGVLSLLALALAAVARYPMHLRWRKTYVITSCVALYFNVFVLIVQLFEKVPALKAFAPTQKEPPFAIAQIACLVVFIVLTIFSVKNFRVS